MRAQSNAANSEPDTVMPFAPALENAAASSLDQLDRAGQTILNMLHNAATNLAEANSQHALEMAQKLSDQLRAAEAENCGAGIPGAVVSGTRPNARNNGCAGVYSEIEDRFLKQSNRREAVTGAPQRNA